MSVLVDDPGRPLLTADRAQVLLVEDEVLVAMIAEDFLSDLGYAAVVAASAKAAIDLVSNGLEPAFAMVDMGLPDGSGDELVRSLRGLRPALRVVIVSGYTEPEIRARFASDVAVTILSKPYTAADLTRTVQALALDRLAP